MDLSNITAALPCALLSIVAPDETIHREGYCFESQGVFKNQAVLPMLNRHAASEGGCSPLTTFPGRPP